MHYSKEKSPCSTFRMITANFRVSEILDFYGSSHNTKALKYEKYISHFLCDNVSSYREITPLLLLQSLIILQDKLGGIFSQNFNAACLDKCNLVAAGVCKI